MNNETNASSVFIDPVCMMKVQPDKQMLKHTHQSRTFYFCAESCRKAFTSDPDKYLVQNPPKRKSWWTRYVNRLNKSTGGKAMKCC